MIKSPFIRLPRKLHNILPVLRCCLLIPALIFFNSFSRNKTEAAIQIHFQLYFQGEPFQLNKKYKNIFGETFSFSRFRFYAGQFAPVYTNSNSKQKYGDKYFLVDFADTSSTYLEIPVSPGDCAGIEFQLGIDSADQSSGAQTGVLDPARGMFWTWNSGYQSFKMEGISPQSNQPGQMIAYHIGGYRPPYNTVWKIRLGTTNDELVPIRSDNRIKMEIPIELDLFFQSPTPIHIIEIPTCTTPGEMARKISENFIGTFTGLTITQNP